MNINRDNYEEFFILYGDNELDAEDRLRVETFVQENPDLQTEFSLLNQVRFAPDETVSFGHSDSLLRTEDPSASASESILLYLDNEMAAADRLEFEQVLEKNSALKAELDSYRRASFDPAERVVFPYKESLYRKEERTRVIPFGWRRIAAAAAVLLAVSVTTYVMMNRKKDAGQDIARTTAPAGIQENKQPVVPVDADAAPQINASVDSPAVQQALVPLREDAVAGNTKPVERKNTGAKQQLKTREDNTPEEFVKNHNNLPKPLSNPNVKADADPLQIAVVTPQPKQSLTQPKQINPSTAVTPSRDDALQLAVNRSADPGDDDLSDQPSRKNKFRGLLRKVTRTFEKTTNIKATDEDDRLLVGGLAIRL